MLPYSPTAYTPLATILSPCWTRAAKLATSSPSGGRAFHPSAPAEVPGVSPATVKRDWSMAKAWLFHRLKSGDRA